MFFFSDVLHHPGDLQPVIKCSKTVQGPDLCFLLVDVHPLCRWCVRVRRTVVNQIIEKTPIAIYLCVIVKILYVPPDYYTCRHTAAAVSSHDNTLSHPGGRQKVSLHIRSPSRWRSLKDVENKFQLPQWKNRISFPCIKSDNLAVECQKCVVVYP